MTTTQPAELHNGVWTSWLPVTTAWTSQSACNSAVWARYGIQPSNNYWPYIYDPAYGQSVANTPTCLPPQATQWWDGDVTSTGTITRFSLGPIVCPGAYTTVSTSLVSDSSTSVICCPRYFTSVRVEVQTRLQSSDSQFRTVTSTSCAVSPPMKAWTAYVHQQ